MSSQIIFWSWLNAVAMNPASKSKWWVDQRIALWRSTALESIQNQIESDWRYVLFTNPLHPGLTRALEKEFEADERVHIVPTFVRPGLMHGPKLDEFRQALPKADRYVVTRIDSDDRYHPRVASMLKKYANRATREKPYLQFNQGYAHVLGTSTVHAWRQRSSPFYARVYNPDFVRPRYPWHAPSHGTVGRHALTLPAGNFLVTIHSVNTSTCREHAGPPLIPRAGALVLVDFGISGVSIPPVPQPRMPQPRVHVRLGHPSIRLGKRTA
jgi:hypothetical protein